MSERGHKLPKTGLQYVSAQAYICPLQANFFTDIKSKTYFKSIGTPPSVWTIHYRGLDFCLAGHIGHPNT